MFDINQEANDFIEELRERYPEQVTEGIKAYQSEALFWFDVAGLPKGIHDSIGPDFLESEDLNRLGAETIIERMRAKAASEELVQASVGIGRERARKKIISRERES